MSRNAPAAACYGDWDGVPALVKAFLKAGVMTEAGDRENSDTGTPQPGILSL